MPRSSIDKSFVAAPVSLPIDQPNSADFLPKYEETLNHNLRNFGGLEAQYGDRMQEPDLKYGLTKKRRAIVVGSLIALVLIMGAVLVGVLSTKLTAGKQQVSSLSSTMFTTTIVAKPTSQISPLPTRATELQPQATSAEATRTTAATPSVVLATTLITTTVAEPSSKLTTSFITVTAKPQTTQAPDSLPPIISTTAFWTKTAPDASFEVFTVAVDVLQLQPNIDNNAYKHKSKHAYKHQPNIDTNVYKHEHNNKQHILRANGKQVHHRFGAVESAGSSDAFAKNIEPGSGAGAEWR
ncbi:hypothetical protein LTR17_021714 [Elasticomyces elasticus]|nr:hypothetical protein LTR17_021714 [Elasticomyces elasticus]